MMPKAVAGVSELLRRKVFKDSHTTTFEFPSNVTASTFNKTGNENFVPGFWSRKGSLKNESICESASGSHFLGPKLMPSTSRGIIH